MTPGTELAFKFDFCELDGKENNEFGGRSSRFARAQERERECVCVCVFFQKRY